MELGLWVNWSAILGRVGSLRQTRCLSFNMHVYRGVVSTVWVTPSRRSITA